MGRSGRHNHLPTDTINRSFVRGTSSVSQISDFLIKEPAMQLGMIGLGRMGANMVRRLLKGGHQCVAFARSPQAVADLVKEKAVGASSLADLVKKLGNRSSDRGAQRPPCRISIIWRLASGTSVRRRKI